MILDLRRRPGLAEFADEIQLARILRCSSRTLRRYKLLGMPWTRLSSGRTVYELREVENWARANCQKRARILAYRREETEAAEAFI